MKTWLPLAIAAVLIAAVSILIVAHVNHRHKAGPMAHARTAFSFTVDAGRDRAFPLFGGSGERAWGTGPGGHAWDPDFVWPRPERDTEGEVFTIAHHHADRVATWINTAFDPAAGHIQYVYFVPDSMVTRIDLQLTEPQPGKTLVAVIYDQTALDTRVNQSIVERPSHADDMAREWRQSVQAALNK